MLSPDQEKQYDNRSQPIRNCNATKKNDLRQRVVNQINNQQTSSQIR